MITILKTKNELLLKELNCKVVKGSSYSCSDNNNQKILTNLKSNFNSYFIENNEKYDFYWINYNNYSDFESGYYNESQKITKDNLNIINIIKNENKSPFLFLDKISIKQLKFITYTKYAYYEIYNEDKKATYYGFIDIVLNKIVFNTDKNITLFQPYSNNSMIFIYDDYAYRFCAISNDYNDDCIDECPKGKKPLYNLNSPNYCGTECNTRYIFIPNEYCIDECDENIYSINEKDECGLCKDLYEDKKFKMVNYTGCLENRPIHSHFINKDLYLLACDKGLDFKNGRCGDDFQCHDNCETCESEPKDDNNQNCITCKSNFVLQGKNCVDKCIDGYYENNKKCEICDKSCKTCNTKPNNCIECNKGYYFENDNKCGECSAFCETCSKGEDNDSQNCLSCKKDSDYPYFYNKNCLDECPENTTFKNDKCIENNSNNNEKKDLEKKEVKKNIILLNIFIIITIISLLIVVFCIIKKICCESKNQYERLTKEILTELN